MKLLKFLPAALMLLSAVSCGGTSSDKAYFEVGKDAVTATTEGASKYAPTFTVNVKIVGGKEEEYFNGKVTLTSDTMNASEFTYKAINDKGLAQEGIATGFVTVIGDYTGGAVGDDYYFWNYTVNDVVANWGCNAYMMRDGDYLLWSFIKMAK